MDRAPTEAGVGDDKLVVTASGPLGDVPFATRKRGSFDRPSPGPRRGIASEASNTTISMIPSRSVTWAVSFPSRSRDRRIERTPPPPL